MQEYFEKNRYDFTSLIEIISDMDVISDVIVDDKTDIEIYDGNEVPKEFLLNVLREFNLLDNLVQDECKKEFEGSNLRIEDYQFAPSWIKLLNDEVKVEYWGIEVNSSFLKTFVKDEHVWKMK